MKSILILVSPESGFNARLDAALAIVRTSGAHLTALQVVDMTMYEAYPSFAGPIYATSYLNDLEVFAREGKERVEKRLSREDVPWDFINLNADHVGNALRLGSLADLIVCSQPDPLFPGFESILMASRTPIMVVPTKLTSFDPTGRAMVAWNGSFEAANALRAAIPLLKLSASVTLVSVGKSGKGDFPSTDALQYLSRHGIDAELREDTETGGFIADRLQVEATALHAAWMVLGAYSHSRTLEAVFGGVTKTMLKNMDIPMLLAR
ncbi:MAG: universal stress protein [Aquidulcibacter sp.]|jgi:nucleotide-binding universal stress UspA family protein|uniref:universal stress protein n=1 Tax=Aquidulcibacter sp. TaxID=2052990 RepID=UPI0022BF03DB|nr:universal stress protein [Aquidulcibacter sp.]